MAVPGEFGPLHVVPLGAVPLALALPEGALASGQVLWRRLRGMA